jgi:hypothetical protein
MSDDESRIPPATPTKPLNTKEACQYLWDKWGYKISPKTLETNRCKSIGFNPKCFYRGPRNVFYWPADLDNAVRSLTTETVHNATEGRQARQALKAKANHKSDNT